MPVTPCPVWLCMQRCDELMARVALLTAHHGIGRQAADNQTLENKRPSGGPLYIPWMPEARRTLSLLIVADAAAICKA